MYRDGCVNTSVQQSPGLFGIINRYLGMIKFAHTIFALPLAGIAFLQALPHTDLFIDGVPQTRFYILLLQVLICMVSLRSAAMGFNRLVDRHIDARNPRTAAREIPSGTISVRAAWTFVILFLLIFVATAYSINWMCAVLAPVAVALVLSYSYTKRFTFLCHYVLGMAIGLAPTGAWIALLERFDLLPLLWSGGLLFYIAGFDILYSCQDRDFDFSAGLHSIPVRFGIRPALWIARCSHLVALGFFSYAGWISSTGPIFYVALAIVAVLFFLEHYLVRPSRLEHIPIAFFHINASISTILFAGILLDVLIQSI